MCLHVSMSLSQSKGMERCKIYYITSWLSFTTVASNNEDNDRMHWHLFTFSSSVISCICLPGNFFPNKKTHSVKGADSSNIQDFFHPLVCSSTLYINVSVFPAEKSNNFQLLWDPWKNARMLAVTDYTAPKDLLKWKCNIIGNRMSDTLW